MKRLCLLLALLLCLTGMAHAQTPTMVQCAKGSVNATGQPLTGENITSYTIPLGQPVLNANLVDVSAGYASTSLTATASDEKGGTWSVAVTESDTTNTQTMKIFYQPNVTSGLQFPKVSFSVSVPFVQIAACEYRNVATSTPLDVAAGNFVASGATSLTAGSATPVSTSIGIAAFLCDSGCASATNVMSAGAGLTARANDNQKDDQLIVEDRLGTGSAVNPGATSTNSIGYVAAVAWFKAAAAGTAPSGVHIAYVGHYNTENGTDLSVTLVVPCQGNHLVVSYTGGAGASGRKISAISSSPSNTWNEAGAGITDAGNNRADIWYFEGGTCSSSMTITFTLVNTDTGSAGDTYIVYDVFGLATSSSLDVSAGTSGTDASATSFTVALLTPTVSGEPVFTCMSVAKDTVTALSSTSPTGANFISTTTGGETPPSHEDENNGNGDLLAATTSQISWTWTHDNSQQTGVGSWAQYAAAFKTASAPTCTPTLTLLGIGRCG